MAHNQRAKKPSPKVNKSGFSGPDSRYRPPRDHEEQDYDQDEYYYEDYSQPEPHNYRRQPTPLSRERERIIPAGKRHLDLNAVADAISHGYEYVFDRSTGNYVKQLKKKSPKTVPEPPEIQPESAKSSKTKRKSVSEEAPQKNKRKWKWGPSLKIAALPGYFYPALTAIVFALVVAHYMGGGAGLYVQQTGVVAWSPNPITEFARTVEASVVHPRKVLASGVTGKERYKNFYGVVKEYCRHVTKGALLKHRYVARHTRIKPENLNPPSWWERVRKVRVPRSWGEFVGNVEYFWWRYGYFAKRDGEGEGEENHYYPTREAGEICEDLKVYIRQAAGEVWDTRPTDDLERSLTYMWPSAASKSLGRLHRVVDLWFRGRAKKAARAKKTATATANLKTRDKIIGAAVGGDGAVLLEEVDGSGAPVWGLNVTAGYAIAQQVQYEFDDFRRIAEDAVQRMRDMDKLLGKIAALADELIVRHQPEEWMVWTKLPEEGVYGITEIAPGWGAMSLKSLGIDERDLENAFKSAGLAQKSWGNVRTMLRDFRAVKGGLERWVEGKDGELVVLGQRLGEVMNQENWGRLGKVQGRQTLRWKYLELSEDMARDLKDKANRVEAVWQKAKKEELEIIKKKVAEDMEREKKEAERAPFEKDRAKWVFQGKKMWYINADGVWT